MSTCSESLELVGTDPSRFDELDVARCIAKLGGTLQGKRAVFRNPSRLAAAVDVLSERFGSRYFVRRGPQYAADGYSAREFSHARES